MIEILKKIPFFAQLPKKDLDVIIAQVKMDYFPAGYTVFRQGDSAPLMYIIKRGTVRVVRDGRVLAELSDNAFFGEMALVSNERRNATVETVTDVELLTLGRDDFKNLMSANPDIASMVSYEVVRRANALS